MARMYTTRMFKNDVKKFTEMFTNIYLKTYNKVEMENISEVLRLELGANAELALWGISTSLQKGFTDGAAYAHSAVVFWHKDRWEPENHFTLFIIPSSYEGPWGTVTLEPNPQTGVFLGQSDDTRFKFKLITEVFDVTTTFREGIEVWVFDWVLRKEHTYLFIDNHEVTDYVASRVRKTWMPRGTKAVCAGPNKSPLYEEGETSKKIEYRTTKSGVLGPTPQDMFLSESAKITKKPGIATKTNIPKV